MFSHDGLKDSLTQLAAPPRFYDELHRELSRCARSGESFVVVKFELQATSQYEEKVLDFAEVLSEASRVEDLCARLGEYEFAILLRGSQSVAVSFIDRVIQRWKQEYTDSSKYRKGFKHQRKRADKSIRTKYHFIIYRPSLERSFTSDG